MRRDAILKKSLNLLDDKTIALFSTGFISREAYNIKDRDRNFYMMGSMGLLSSIGIGLLLGKEEKVIIFDGDGSFLMGSDFLSTLNLIDNNKDFIHIVLNNQAYGSTGNQNNKNINIEKYRNFYDSFCVIPDSRRIDDLESIINNWRGKILVDIRINNLEFDKDSKRILNPIEKYKNFKESINE